MNCSPTLSVDEFRVLHNTLCELSYIDDGKVQGLVERIRNVALKGAYEQDNRAFDTKHGYYTKYQRDHDLQATWSIYSLEQGGFENISPFANFKYVVYTDHCGDTEVVKPIEGSTWGDLYRAADQAIGESGDMLHCFIERFKPIASRPEHLQLFTGS